MSTPPEHPSLMHEYAYEDADLSHLVRPTDEEVAAVMAAGEQRRGAERAIAELEKAMKQHLEQLTQVNNQLAQARKLQFEAVRRLRELEVEMARSVERRLKGGSAP